MSREFGNDDLRASDHAASSGTANEAPIGHDLRWPVVSLAEITTKIGSGATPKGGADAYLPSRTRFALVRSQNVYDRRFDHDGLAFITDEQADSLRGATLQPNDILLNITGDGLTFGRACMVPTDVLPACVNQHVSIIRLNPQHAVPGYVLAFLTHPEVKSYIESFNAGGSRRAITKGHIESFRLPLPPLPEQRAIAHILGTLDDKIELNRRMSETLEAMTQALFKSWFVDFDPVRAKAEGREPVLPEHLSSLFPESFEESGSGVVPAGWRSSKWGELVELRYGKALAGYDRDNQGYPVYGTNGRIGTHAEALCPHPGIIIGRKGAYRGVHYCDSPFFVIDTAFYVEPKVPLELRWAHYELLQLDINSMDSGSAIPSTSREDFYGLPVLAPPIQIQEKFVDLLQPVWRRQAQNERESRTLATLRDTLLPKLISGELRVKDAQRRIEETG